MLQNLHSKKGVSLADPNQNCECGYRRGWAAGGFFSNRSHWGESLLGELDGFIADGKAPFGCTRVATLQAGSQHWGYCSLNWRGIFINWEDRDIGLPMNTLNCRNSPIRILSYVLSVMPVAILICVQNFCLKGVSLSPIIGIPSSSWRIVIHK